MRLPITMLATGLVVTACTGDESGPGPEAIQLAFISQPGTGTAG